MCMHPWKGSHTAHTYSYGTFLHTHNTVFVWWCIFVGWEYISAASFALGGLALVRIITENLVKAFNSSNNYCDHTPVGSTIEDLWCDSIWYFFLFMTMQSHDTSQTIYFCCLNTSARCLVSTGINVSIQLSLQVWRKRDRITWLRIPQMFLFIFDAIFSSLKINHGQLSPGSK